MNWAIVALTKDGTQQGKKIKKILNNINLEIYTLKKWSDEETLVIDKKLEEFVGSIFHKYDIIIFIMATGIVVRSIAKHIVNKTTDPGVLVMDEKGQFVISLLSGHLGGANEAAKLLADKMGGQPVITTASDVKGLIAVDTLAQKLNCQISSMDKAKNLTGLIVNNESVLIKSNINIDMKLPDNILTEGEAKGTIFITNRVINKFSEYEVQLIPKNIVIGIGCRSGISGEAIVNAIKEALDLFNIDYRSIKHFATVDIKQNEAGIFDAAKHFKTIVKIVNRKEIKNIEHEFHCSEFVRKSIGVGAVCEPCALLTASKGHFLMRKKSYNGITLSIWEEL
ncbi:cobalt-precorrin 5A acetaldehyde-lyase [Proteiniborus ethanoligenes]|uniref:Cobalt-precorrin 5A acetaldehyde-lyase n=1 Tax=Proteiniborus ethanoligenes TaxID=415015 RepID=A0A1H3QJX8_9FIRM|nr:cobalt-precorrin 5A hydrolase [Proteiniborus ethanoligenes]SDZ13613.1 cobalt-precorrin 5A acetaldehyde-lyase [Proteiniborus ethanoligenes]